MSDTNTHVPWRALFVSGVIGPLILVCLGVLLHAMDGLLVATMLPAIVAEIGGVHLIAWVVMLYEVGSIVAGVACGLLISRHGLRLPMTIAALIFAIGCAVSALALTMPVLLWGRALQGLGGGGMMAMSFVAAGLMFPPHLQARVIGLVSTIWAASAFMGPLLGGLFVERASWQAAFWFFTILALGLALLIFWLNPQAGGFDVPETSFPLRRLAVLLMGVMAIAYAGEDISALRTPLLLLLGLALIAAFLRLDHRSDNRLLPQLDLKLAEPITAGLATILLFAIATIAIGTYGPYFLTLLFGLKPITAGALIAVEAIGWAGVAALFSGRPEHEDNRNIRIGFFIVTAGVALLAFTISSGPVWLITVAGFLQGAGFGLAWAFLMRRLLKHAGETGKALISGAIPTVQRLGYAIGAAIIGLTANMAGIEHGDPATAAFFIFIVGVVPAAIGLWTLSRFLKS